MTNKKIKIFLSALCLALALNLSPVKVAAADCPNGKAHPAGNTATCATILKPSDCSSGKVEKSDPTKCVPLGNGCVGQTASRCLKDNKIVSRLNQVVNILSGLVGLVVVISLIIGGIQYTLAEDNPQKVGAARARITHALIALIVFAFLFAILQWLIPGGIFG